MRRLLATLVLLAIGCSDGPRTMRLALECDAGDCVDRDFPRKAYRVTEARLLDPHFFSSPIFIGCTDVTDHAPVGAKSANETIAESLGTDDDGDGFFDFGVLVELDPSDPAAGGGDLTVSRALCPTADTATCQIDPREPTVTATFENRTADCLAPDPAVLSSADYVPSVRAVEPTCFFAEGVRLPFEFGDTAFTLRDTRVSGRWEDGELDGLMIGFVTLADAREAKVRRKTLAEFLPGGEDVCARHDDTDLHAQRIGWWFHIDFVAEPIEIIPPPPTRLTGSGCGG